MNLLFKFTNSFKIITFSFNIELHTLFIYLKNANFLCNKINFQLDRRPYIYDVDYRGERIRISLKLLYRAANDIDAALYISVCLDLS